MVRIIFGLVLIGISAGLIYWRRKSQDKLLEIKATPTSTAKDLHELCQSVKDGMGNSGGFKQLAEVKGVVKCDNPIFGELSKRPCVYYEMKIYEEREGDHNILQADCQSTPFEVEDATGRIRVNPNGARIDPILVVNKFKRKSASKGTYYIEQIIPVDRSVYVIGEATDSSGELMIQEPSEKGQPFVITLESEEELVRYTATKIKALLIGAIILLTAGMIQIAYFIIENL